MYFLSLVRVITVETVKAYYITAFHIVFHLLFFLEHYIKGLLTIVKNYYNFYHFLKAHSKEIFPSTVVDI